MNEREALIAAIAANPNDDTPRLVFADWLQEHGEDDRAEFIRLQCELDSLWRTGRSGEDIEKSLQYRRIQKQANELLDSRWSAWFHPFLHALGAEETVDSPPRRFIARVMSRFTRERRRVSYERDRSHTYFPAFKASGNGPIESFSLLTGFVYSLDITFASSCLIRDLATAFVLEPVTSIWIRFAANEAQWQLFDVPILKQLRSVTLDLGERHDRKLARLFDAMVSTENWPDLHDLTLWGIEGPSLRPPRAYIEQFARSPLLARVRGLSVRTDLLGLRLLTRVPAARFLRSFSTRFTELGGDIGEVLAGAVWRNAVESLGVSLSGLGDEGVRELVSGGPWPKLQSINFGFNPIGDVGIRYLLPLVPQLTNISLCEVTITDTGALSLAEAIDPAKLKSLWLSYNPLSPGVVQSLRERFGERFHFTTQEEDDARRRAGGL